MADFLGLMKQAAELKSKMEAMQAELDQLEVEGTSGGRLVGVKLSGKGEMKAVKVDDTLMKPSEKEIVEDLIVAAHCRRAAQGRGAAAGQDENRRRRSTAAARRAVPGRLWSPSAVPCPPPPARDRTPRPTARPPARGSAPARLGAPLLFLIKKREQIMAPLAAAMQTALEKIEICRVCGNIDTQNRARSAPTCGAIRDHRGGRRRRRPVGAQARARGQRAITCWAARFRRSAASATEIPPSTRWCARTIRRWPRSSSRSTPPSTARPRRYITDLLHEANVKVTRLAHGVPVGGELDYLDEGTLAAAIRQRTTL